MIAAIYARILFVLFLGLPRQLVFAEGLVDLIIEREGPAQSDAAAPAWYIQALKRKIAERWEGSQLATGSAVGAFEIMPDGRLGQLEIERSSGDPGRDQLMLRAIREAGPFPRLPQGGPMPLRLRVEFR